MSKFTVEVKVGVPQYTWGDGYHLNGAVSPDSILNTIVFPTLDKLTEGSVVADFGCGEGRIAQKAPFYSNRPYIFRGFEINPAAVEGFNRGFAHTLDRAEVADLTRLDVGQTRFDAALLWRVLHSIPKDYHQAVLAGIATTLKPGASLHVAVLSERDWKKVDLERLGLYRPGEMNDCYPVMGAALEPQAIFNWPLYFFRGGELAGLGEQVGLREVNQQPIREESGFEILRQTKPPISYDYVEFVKP
ncbi:class I SAM-dependent methyltransferase [Candidatus Daviesbacteria bacterium]|nr:class I SAM-dependent methyltransferase [Candidatus Daviesbacteria bacterium]MBI4038478.1 class I SAM-dependent methyltransferase [Candidatus Daviesbacteria bacterium]